jgi:hypothetical protein
LLFRYFLLDVFGLTTKTKGEKMDPIEQMIADAPDELKNRLIAHHNSVKRLRRAEKQAALWAREHHLANEMFGVTEKDYQNVLSRWRWICSFWNSEANTSMHLMGESETTNS